MHVVIASDRGALIDLVSQCARIIWPDRQLTVIQDAAAVSSPLARGVELLILDCGLPEALATCRALRAVDPLLPIFALGAGVAVMEEVRALDAGADDFVRADCDHLVLLARLRALVRRPRPTWGDDSRVPGSDLTLDFARREVTVRGELVALTPTEYVLLETLARERGRIVPHRALLTRVWGPTYTRELHYLKVFINRLRRKLGEDAARPRYIQTCRGLGYRMLNVVVEEPRAPRAA